MREPAFPIPDGEAAMSLRDWFAGHAAGAIFSRWGGMEGPALDGVAKRSYELADAMMRARSE